MFRFFRRAAMTRPRGPCLPLALAAVLIVGFRGVAAEPPPLRAVAAGAIWECAWPDPDTGQLLRASFAGDAFIVLRPGREAVLTALGSPGRSGRFRLSEDQDSASRRVGPEGEWMGRLTVGLPEDGRPALRTLRLEFDEDPDASPPRPARQVTVWFQPPMPSRAAANGFGMVRAGDFAIGQFNQPTGSGNRKVRDNPAAYRPPAWYMVMPPEALNAELAPGMRLGDWVAPTEATGERHTLVAPVNYRLWMAVNAIRRSLATRGVPPEAFRIISAYRSPAYNRRVGSGSFGRHMYGDAIDFYLDTRGSGQTGDLNGDGRVDRRDALWGIAFLEDLMAEGRIPMGGVGVYTFAGGKRVTWHYDQRGHRATWAYHTNAAGQRTEFAWQSRRFAQVDRQEEQEARERARQEGRAYSAPRRDSLP